MKKLKLGDKVICTRVARKRWWKKGKIYEVVKSKNTGKLVVLDEEEDERDIRIVEHYLNSDVMLNFELYKEENKMQEYKRGYLQEGMLLKCISTKTKDSRWIVGKTYEIKKHDNGLIYLTDENGCNWHEDAILNFLSKNDLFNTKLEKVKEENKMNYTTEDIYEGMQLRCVETKNLKRWDINRIYTVTRNDFNLLILTDKQGNTWHSRIIAEFLNGFGHVKFKEENNMQEFKVGDLVEVVKNNSHAYKNKGDFYQVGDKAIVTEVVGLNVRIGNNKYGNLISKHEIKKLEPTPEITEYEEELVLSLAEKIKEKEKLTKAVERDKEILNHTIKTLENKQKEIKEITIKLLSK